MRYINKNSDTNLVIKLVNSNGGNITSYADVSFIIYKGDTTLVEYTLSDHISEIKSGVVLVTIQHTDIAGFESRDYSYKVKVDNAEVEYGVLRFRPFNTTQGYTLQGVVDNLENAEWQNFGDKTWEEIS